jgi:tripartite-type tricarboxylate transporter receptor subunit TctC
MSKHLPGHPVFVAKNMPGAGHVNATNFMYNQAPSDGTHVATIGNTIPLHQVLDGKGVRYDAAKFNWIGTTGISNLMTVAWAASGIKTIDEAFKREVIAGGTGAGSGTVLYPTVTNNLLGTKFKIIVGWRSAGEIDLAMERGEVHSRNGFSLGSLLIEHPEWVNERKVNFLMQVGGEREKMFPEVPLMSDLARNDEERQVLTLISSTVSVGRPLLTTPQIPADRLAALRAAFNATMTDPEFLSEAERLKFDLRPAGWQRLTKVVAETVNAPPEIIEKAKQAMERDQIASDISGGKASEKSGGGD